MENTIEFYKNCIKQLLSRYESFKTDNAYIELIFDDKRMRYMATWIGWKQNKRIHQCAVHIDISDENILIQWNDTEDQIEKYLIEMGIPKDKICLEVIPPYFRS
ncbi:XisI protein [Candidatus Parabeggiatoa sp. HSG14]|uniref:XisI protein n=1 Tax=Candidatus Parabeggiatoa sp. HSG14 TaxID=3055593 RepID=UPI0025A82DB2|nr:XisI protein [Thiotrichales bacterium HSG14]